MIAYRRDFDETTCMSFLIKNGQLSEKYSEILDKVSDTIKKGFDNESVCYKEHLGTKRKSSIGKISTHFHRDKIPKKPSQCLFLSVILIDSVFRTGRNCYPQVYLEKFKYVVKTKKLSKYINDETEISPDKNFDEENSDEKNYSEEKWFFLKDQF